MGHGRKDLGKPALETHLQTKLYTLYDTTIHTIHTILTIHLSQCSGMPYVEIDDLFFTQKLKINATSGTPVQGHGLPVHVKKVLVRVFPK